MARVLVRGLNGDGVEEFNVRKIILDAPNGHIHVSEVRGVDGATPLVRVWRSEPCPVAHLALAFHRGSRPGSKGDRLKALPEAIKAAGTHPMPKVHVHTTEFAG